MISSNKLALSALVVVLAASVFAGRAAFAGQPSHKNFQKHQNHHHGSNFNHHHRHHHFHQPHFGPVFVPTKQQVRVLYCVMVRQPSRYHDWNFHQVKCFGSAHEAEFFAATMRSRSGGEHGYAVRIDRRHW